jgi:DNA-binding winged helix-turn-helix (wHTH) protein/TolB-like protein/Flp pilus assembly protein TadD
MPAAGETDRPMPGKEIRVGAWLVTPSRGELQGGGKRLRIEPKVMEVLVALASRPCEVISRDELLSAIWPGVIVGDDALTQAVIKLRKALGDDARSPAYVETISKRGYRLIASVDQPDGAPAIQPFSVGGVRRPWWQAAAAGVLLASLIAGSSLFHAVPEEPSSSLLDITQPAQADIDRRFALPTAIIMPFAPLSGHFESAHLARAIVADLTTDLSRLEGIQVIDGSQFAGKAPNASQQGARYVVSGILHGSADQLRLSVQLTDAETGRPFWSERYEHPFRDFFAIQEDIVGQLVATLRVKVSEAERHRIATPHTRNLEAYDLFVRAQKALLTRQRADNEEARQLYRQALRLDPTFARAYAGLALTYAADYRYQLIEQGPQALGRAGELAKTAFGINPDIPEVHWVLAYVDMQHRRHEEAMAHLKRAITLDRLFADAYSLLGSVHNFTGEPQKAVAMVRAAARLNRDRGYFLNLGRAYFFLGDAEQAAINLREALSRNAGNLEARIYLAAALALAGDREGAGWETEEIRALAPDFSASKWLETYPLTDARQRDRLTSLLAELGL